MRQHKGEVALERRPLWLTKRRAVCMGSPFPGGRVGGIHPFYGGAMNLPYSDSVTNSQADAKHVRSFTMTMADGAMSAIVLVDGAGTVARYPASSTSAACGDDNPPEVFRSPEYLRFRTLLEHSPYSTQVFSPDGWTISVNQAWLNLWGATTEIARSYNILHDKQLVKKGIMPYVQRGFAGEATAYRRWITTRAKATCQGRGAGYVPSSIRSSKTADWSKSCSCTKTSQRRDTLKACC